jgi:ribosomal protein S27E
MTLPVECPSCHKTYTAPQRLAGRKAKCRYCGASLTIPKSGPEAISPSPKPTTPLRPVPSPPDHPIPLRTEPAPANVADDGPKSPDFRRNLLIAGIILALLIVYAIYTHHHPAPPPSVIGVWSATQDLSTGPLYIDLKLHDDYTFRCILRGDQTADFAGEWRLEENALQLQVTKVTTGDDKVLGKKIPFGNLERLTDSEMTLKLPAGATTYQRQR